MSDPNRQYELMESALSDLAAAERSRVFDRTSVDTEALVVSPPVAQTIAFKPTGLRLVGLVAVLALAAGVWTMMFQMELSDIRASKLAGSNSLAAMVHLTDCLGGPGQAVVSSDCTLQDRYADGRVDLRDYQVFQNTYTGTPN